MGYNHDMENNLVKDPELQNLTVKFSFYFAS